MFFRKLAKALSNKKYRSNPVKENLSEKQLVSLNIGAVNAEQRSCYCDSLDTGGDIQETAQGLAQSYGINDQDTAVDVLNWLKERGHRILFEAIRPFISGQSSGIMDDFLDEDEKLETYTYIVNLKSTIDILLEKGYIADIHELSDISITAWDMGRLVLVARSCYDCGYITEETAWDYIDTAYEISKQCYSDWKEFASGYVIGRCMWGGNNMSLQGIMGITEDLLTDEQSPWKQYTFL